MEKSYNRLCFKDAKTVRVFGIVRVSTDKQAQKIGESLDHQKKFSKIG
jgi:hypothetical protein